MFFSVPIPQIFQRFYGAADDTAITKTMCFYPLAKTILFFMTVSIGVMGVAIMPSLKIGKSDEVLMLLLQVIASPLLAATIIVGALAALMSMLSAQVLSLSSITVQDFLPQKVHRLFCDRFVIAAISIVAFVIALDPPLTILEFLSKPSFHGLPVRQ